jgi:ribosomal protein L21E
MTYHIGDYVDIRVNDVVHKDMLARTLGMLDQWCGETLIVGMSRVLPPC